MRVTRKIEILETVQAMTGAWGFAGYGEMAGRKIAIAADEIAEMIESGDLAEITRDGRPGVINAE